MNLIDNPRVRRTLFVILFIVLVLLCSAAVIYSQEFRKVEYGPQVLLIVGKSENGTMRVAPKSQVWFRIGPLASEFHPAPLPEGTNMLCRAYDFHATNGTFLALRCGLDEYLVQAVGMSPEK